MGNIVPGKLRLDACVACGHLMTICVYHIGGIELLKAPLYFLCMRFCQETYGNSNQTKEEKGKNLTKMIPSKFSCLEPFFLASDVHPLSLIIDSPSVLRYARSRPEDFCLLLFRTMLLVYQNTLSLLLSNGFLFSSMICNVS